MAAALEGAVEALRSKPTPPPPAPDAAAVVARLTAALRAHDTRFLDDYLRVLVSHSDAEVKAVTDELTRNIDGALEAGEGAGAAVEGTEAAGVGGVVLTSWLAAAAAWRAPHPPAAPRALYAMLQLLKPQQVVEVARALHGSLEARELVIVSDSIRGAEARAMGVGAGPGQRARAWVLAGETGLAALLLRAALARLLGEEVAWQAGALAVDELDAALSTRWDSLDAEVQLVSAGVAARVVAGAAARAADGARGEGAVAARLLAKLAHPPPLALRHHTDYLKATVALSRLQRLFKHDATVP